VAVEFDGVTHGERPPGLEDQRTHEVLDDLLECEREHQTGKTEGAEQRADSDTEPVECVHEADEKDQVADDARRDDGPETGADRPRHDRAGDPVGGDRHRDRPEQDSACLQPVGADHLAVEQPLDGLVDAGVDVRDPCEGGGEDVHDSHHSAADRSVASDPAGVRPVESNHMTTAATAVSSAATAQTGQYSPIRSTV